MDCFGKLSSVYYERLEDFRHWWFSKPIARYLKGRNDRGRSIMYLHGGFAHSVKRKGMIKHCFMKGWY